MNCTRHGCGGCIDEGYCDRCGLAPARDRDRAGTRLPAPQAMSEPAPEAPTQRVGGPTRSRSVARRQLGAGLVEVPAASSPEPLRAVMADPQVAEPRRFCHRCGSPVGRAREAAAGRREGYCPRCGTPFSFVPKLRAGDVVGEQYEVAGCLAHGGLGWIYLARDRNVADRWV
ncbi:MAG: serine/threonine-protein kinase PknG, partial [Solirubrobacteraceae bacterium]|nr:serine/threonine-protein kinase PknG [Solirubrobacteraceae bacterium]